MLQVEQFMVQKRLQRIIVVKARDHIHAEQHRVYRTHLGRPTVTSSERMNQVDGYRWHKVRKDFAEMLDGDLERFRKPALDITIRGTNGGKVRQRLVDTAHQASQIFIHVKTRRESVERG